jgi:hypothetical protein
MDDDDDDDDEDDDLLSIFWRFLIYNKKLVLGWAFFALNL